MQPHTPASTTDIRRSQTARRGWRHAAALSAAALALVAAPAMALAAGNSKSRAHSAILSDNTPLKGAIHNPASSSFLRTTGIFANFNSWTARIQNLGSGGAGIFGCKATGSACLASENSKSGLAFTFATNGNVGGQILLTNPNGAPFTTNAHGEATGLNANYLQGKQASEFQLASKPAANSEALGGVPATEYAKTSQLLFADVSSAGTIQSTRGATAASTSTNSFTITFGTLNVSKCSYTASPQGAALTSGALGVEAATGNASAVVVNAPAGFAGGVDLQVVC